MNRRNFLRTLISSGALYSANGLPTLIKNANASGFPAPGSRIMANIMLSGAPDMRHLMPPEFDADPNSYGYKYWEARAASHNLGDTPSEWQTRWTNEYTSRSSGGTTFGILNSCDWLKSQWDLGNVAIINNAVGGETRNHSHCRLIMDQGNLSSSPNDVNRSGWGGRFAATTSSNALALTKVPRQFCFSQHDTDPESHTTDHMISILNSRNYGLFQPEAGDDTNSSSSKLSRSLSAYYAAKEDTIAANSPFRKFLKHEQNLRSIGNSINDRLATNPLPASISALAEQEGEGGYFGQQIRNLYDSLLSNDLLSFNTVSMEYRHWDTHDNQLEEIEPQLQDLFGANQALDTLYQEVPDAILDQMVFVIGGEFGRQLKANGDAGTDHGRGTSLLVIGNQVNGGIYGDMFPASELARLGDDSPDIEGLTTFDNIFGRVCEWVQPGSEALVFPDRTYSRMEAGVDFSGMFV